MRGLRKPSSAVGPVQEGPRKQKQCKQMCLAVSVNGNWGEWNPQTMDFLSTCRAVKTSWKGPPHTTASYTVCLGTTQHKHKGNCSDKLLLHVGLVVVDVVGAQSAPTFGENRCFLHLFPYLTQRHCYLLGWSKFLIFLPNITMLHRDIICASPGSSFAWTHLKKIIWDTQWINSPAKLWNASNWGAHSTHQQVGRLRT